MNKIRATLVNCRSCFTCAHHRVDQPCVPLYEGICSHRIFYEHLSRVVVLTPTPPGPNMGFAWTDDRGVPLRDGEVILLSPTESLLEMIAEGSNENSTS